jgi:hypothetical protein
MHKASFAIILFSAIFIQAAEFIVPELYYCAWHKANPFALDMTGGYCPLSAHDSTRTFVSLYAPLQIRHSFMLAYSGGAYETGYRNPGLESQRIATIGQNGRFNWSAGIGYNPERIRNVTGYSHMYYPYYSDFDPEMYEDRSITASAIDRSNYYWNLNGSMNVGKGRELLIGSDLNYCSMQGARYHEWFSSTAEWPVLEYWDFRGDARKTVYQLGIGYWRISTARRGPVSFLADIKWKHKHEYNTPGYTENVQPYFSYSNYYPGPTMQFPGINRSDDELILRVSLGDQYPDFVPKKRPYLFGFLGAQAILERLSAFFMADFSNMERTNINRWERDGSYYWGETKQSARYNRLSLGTDDAFRFYLLKFAFVNISYFNKNSITWYGDRRIFQSEWDGAAGFGLRLLVKNAYLGEVGCSFIQLHPTLYYTAMDQEQYHSSGNFTMDGSFLAQIYLRFAIRQ